MSVNSGLKATKIIGHRKAFYRQRIPEFSYARKETVDIDIPKKVIDRRKTSKTLSEVKPVENINKNLQSFLEISPVQKKVLSHKLLDHVYEY